MNSLRVFASFLISSRFSLSPLQPTTIVTINPLFFHCIHPRICTLSPMDGSSPSFPPLSSAYDSPEPFRSPSHSSKTLPTYTTALNSIRRSSVDIDPTRPCSLSPTDSESSQSLYQNPSIETSNRSLRRESAGGNNTVGSLVALDASLRKDRLEEIRERNNKILNRISSRSTTVRDRRDLRSQPGTPEPKQRLSSYGSNGASPSRAVWSESTIAASPSSSSFSSPFRPVDLLSRNISTGEEAEQGELSSVSPTRSHRLMRRSSFDSQPDEEDSESESESDSRSERVSDARVHSRAASAPYGSRRSPLSELSQRARPSGQGIPLGQNLSLPFVSDEHKRAEGRERRKEILNRSKSRASLGYSSRAETPSFTSSRVPRSVTADDLGSPFPPASSSAVRRRAASNSFDLYSKTVRSPTISPEELNGSPTSQPPSLPASNRLPHLLSSSSNGTLKLNSYSSAELNSSRSKGRVNVHESRSSSQWAERAASDIGCHSKHSPSDRIKADLFGHDDDDGHDRSSARSKVANRTRDLLDRIERENEASDRKRQALVENQAMKRAESSLSIASTSNGFGFRTPGSATDLNRIEERIYPNATRGIVRSSTSLSHFPEQLSGAGTSAAADILRSRSRSHRSVFSLTPPGSSVNTSSATSNAAAAVSEQKRFSGSLSVNQTTNTRVRSPLSHGRRSSVLTGSPMFPPLTSISSHTPTETQSRDQIQPEHIRNLLDALSHLEMSFARTRDSAGPSSAETVRSALAFVRSATVLHQTISQGFLANRELVVDSQVNYGSAQAQEQGQRDVGDGLVALGMTWKEAGRVHAEQVRALTDLLIGLPRWMREVIESRSDESVLREEQVQVGNVLHASSKSPTSSLSESASIRTSPYRNSIQVPPISLKSVTLARASLSPSLSSASETENSTTSSLSSSLSRQLSSLTIEPEAEVETKVAVETRLESDPEAEAGLKRKVEDAEESSYTDVPARSLELSLLTPSTSTSSNFHQVPSPLMPPPSSILSPPHETSSDAIKEASWQPTIKPYSVSPSSGTTASSTRRSSLFPLAPKVSPAATTAATAIQAFSTNQSPSERTSVEDSSDLSDNSVNSYLPPLSAPLSTSGQTMRLNMPFLGRSNTLGRIPASSSVGLGAGAASASTSGGPVVGVSDRLSRRLSVEQSLNNQSVKLGLENGNGDQDETRNGVSRKVERPGPVSSAFRKLSFFGGN